MKTRSMGSFRVVPGVYPEGGWIPFSSGLYGYACIGDGNCFWRAAAVQVHGTQDRYIDMRHRVFQYVRDHPDLELEGLPLALAVEASGYPSVEAWMSATVSDGEFAGFVEAALLARCYGYRIEIYVDAVPTTPNQVFNPQGNLCLRFHFRHSHYNALFYEDLR